MGHVIHIHHLPTAGITERCQLGAADAIALHAVQGGQAQAALSAPTEKQTTADRAAASASLAASRQLPGTWHFPVGHIREEPRNLLVRVSFDSQPIKRSITSSYMQLIRAEAMWRL